MSRANAALALPVALLAALALAPPSWHLPAMLVAWALLRATAQDVQRSFGRLRRWALALVILCLLGAAFGPRDARLLSLAWSRAGALSATTMVARAFAIVSLTSLAASALPMRDWLRRARNPVVRRLLEVIIVASNLVPVQLRALSTASANLRERRPGLLKLPQRAWLLAAHASLRAALLAESVAFDMAVAAHNALPDRKESP